MSDLPRIYRSRWDTHVSLRFNGLDAGMFQEAALSEMKRLSRPLTLAEAHAIAREQREKLDQWEEEYLLTREVERDAATAEEAARRADEVSRG